ncbi:hypothetical protein Q4508_07710 [Amphritea sp. 2_MG-2023]|uniref:hypothetical protein n=1 Tax=Amphritea TaxID=515417 RepID=UPI001C07DD1A|nr:MULTISPECIES: hypothetical protein [Amphritea]MBU2964040.1 hypothetical protein [Amphritea atlantica]MDO6418440.1 hypothetical protein [Amphritea sp. 2_MG-2023]
MTLHQEIQLRLSNCNLEDICHWMGYKDDRASSRIQNVMSDRSLGLFQGAYDLKYSDAEFLSKLCSVLGIDLNEYQADLDAIHAEREDRRNRFKSYVFVDTGFVRTTQPIFALALCSSQRYIQLEYETRIKPISEQIMTVRHLVKNHYEQHSGQLGMWGDIQKYRFVYAEGMHVEVSADGVILGESGVVPTAQPSLKIGHKNITPMITSFK